MTNGAWLIVRRSMPLLTTASGGDCWLQLFFMQMCFIFLYAPSTFCSYVMTIHTFHALAFGVVLQCLLLEHFHVQLSSADKLVFSQVHWPNRGVTHWTKEILGSLFSVCSNKYDFVLRTRQYYYYYYFHQCIYLYTRQLLCCFSWVSYDSQQCGVRPTCCP